MPRPRERTRTKKRVCKPLPGGGRGTSYTTKRTALIRCSNCNRPLTGLQHRSTLGGRKMNRGKRRVWRPFGGQLCSDCLRQALKRNARTL